VSRHACGWIPPAGTRNNLTRDGSVLIRRSVLHVWPVQQINVPKLTQRQSNRMTSLQLPMFFRQ
jgi:hypothetical protein